MRSQDAMPAVARVRRIACVGEVMIELAPEGPHTARIGVAGDTYNTAVHLVRELADMSDATVSYVTALGDDAFSQRILDHMAAHGVAAHVERRAGGVPGLYAIALDAAGERSFTYWRSTSAARTLFQPPCTVGLDVLGGFDLVFLSGITLAILPPATREALADALTDFRAHGGLVAFDGNYRPALWPDAATARAAMDRLWAMADIALPSLDDELALHGGLPDRLKGRTGALKRGGDGPVDLATGAPLEGFRRVAVVDSTGAGDAFDAGYIAALVAGRSPAEALARGHALAARTVGHRGAIPEAA